MNTLPRGLTPLRVANDIGRMRLIDAATAESYLRDSGRIDPGERVRISELTGGVSNMVLLVERPEQPASDFVIKQARAQLRTRHEWFSSLERIWREAEVLTICQRLLAEAPPRDGHTLEIGTPRVLFEDRENYLFGMTAVPRPHVTWKSDLLAGTADARVADACGRLLGTLHAESWNRADLAGAIGDRTLFEELRVDPYYRTLCVQRPEAKSSVSRLIESLAGEGRSLVQGDFSPKNLLLSAHRLTLVDFETGHYGDPAFDLGFFLSHLVLKASLRIPEHAPYLELTERFRQSYEAVSAIKIPHAEYSNLWVRGIQNFAACAWARLDGKSPVEYLSDVGRRELVRALCRDVLEHPPECWSDVFERATRLFAAAN